jgi:signal transduction histidine kinase
MRVPLALDSAAGERLAASPSIERRLQPGQQAGDDLVRIPFADGRVLWLGRPGPRRGEMGPPPGMERRPGMGPGPMGGLRTPGWLDEIGVLLTLLAVLYLAVAAGAYPVVRRLTRRLEALKQGVQAFGDGDLARQVPIDGSDEIAALAASFNQAARRIDELMQANRSLLANASHELRSPLARLKMAVEMMDGAEPARRAALKAEIDRDVAELDALVEEVLLASRLGARRDLSRQPVDLLGLLAEEAARTEASVDGVPLAVTGDERLLRRALRNLLENAQRYGGGEVDATLSRGPGGTVELRVCDRGPGVPAEFRERVFEPFFRLPGHAERAGGVGLGLALVQQIAQHHGGMARCEAREGGGGCFVLTLPAA